MVSEECPYVGRILRVDLSTGKVCKEQFDPRLLRQFVGGVGTGTKIMYDEVPPNVMPYDPENRLIFAAGPMSGTRAPGAGTYCVVTKGPLTNGLTSTQGNGFFGARMRFAGYDTIIIQGASPKWVYLWIHDGEVELRPADSLVGLDNFDTDDKVKELVGESRASVACISQAGENLVKFACICSDKGHFASTNGPGAVMGSKKLKAVAAFGSTSGVKVKDPKRIEELRGPWLEAAKKTPLGRAVSTFGTNTGLAMGYITGLTPVKNMTTNIWPAGNAFDGENFHRIFEARKRPCWACPWGHCHIFRIREGRYQGFEGEEPEGEGTAAFGSGIGITDPNAMLYLHTLNDRLGMDLKEIGWLLGLAMECYEKGIITKEDTDGQELTWGNVDAVESLLHNIANRRGFGNILAEGTMRAAARIGGGAHLMAVYAKQGIAPNFVDERWSWCFQTSLAVTDQSAYAAIPLDIYVEPDLGFPKRRPWTPEFVAPSVAKSAALWHFKDTLGMCQFTLTTPPQNITDMLSATTGWDFTPQEALDVGERITTLQRAYSIRHNIIPETWDSLSPRFLTSPVDGGAKGKGIAPHFPKIRREYYRIMGWDEETSKPLPETLKRLGLDFAIKDLWR